MTSLFDNRESQQTLRPDGTERSFPLVNNYDRNSHSEALDNVGNGLDNKDQRTSRPFSTNSTENYNTHLKEFEHNGAEESGHGAHHESSDDSLRRQKSEAEEGSKEQSAGNEGGDEEKGQGSPPKPVGFWDKSLKKTRLLVFRRWLTMSSLYPTYKTDPSLIHTSCYPLSVYFRYTLPLLGRPFQCRREP